jgi:xylulokinase
MALVLGLDIGTTSTIGILIRMPDHVVAIATRPVAFSSPRPGWAEENPRQWWSNVCEITRELLASDGASADDVRAVGVSGMLPAVVLIDEAGEILRPSIQQSDGRCGAQVEALRREIDEREFITRAGNGVNQQLVIAKLRWVEENEPEVFARIATVFGSYDYVNWRLTGERAVEQNWALEAGFVDLIRHAVADDLVALAHVPRRAIPRMTASQEVLGRISAAAAAETGLRAGIPVVGGGADHIASALAAGTVRPGDALLKFGGAVDVLVVSETAKPDPRMYLDYHLVPGLFVPNGCMASGGTALNWFAANFAGGELAAAREGKMSIHQRLDILAETTPPGAGGVKILPYFLGEKTPIHDPNARGLVTGLSLAHGLGHVWRALLESFAYAIKHHVEVFTDMGHRPVNFLASDGGSASRVWMQIVADVLQSPVQRLTGHPGSCLGAAWTAAVGAGLTNDWSGVSRFVGWGDRILPDAAKAPIYAEGYRAFHELYRRPRDAGTAP